MKKINNTDFRNIMGCFTTGIAVATAQNKTLGDFGLTINSFTSVSLDPPLVLFCLDKEAHLHKAFRNTGIFAINILADNQSGVSRHFAARNQPVPKNLWDKPQQTCPILQDTLGWILCKPYKFYAGGDHTIMVGEVVGLHKNAAKREPLIYFHGDYRVLGKETSGARK